MGWGGGGGGGGGGGTVIIAPVKPHVLCGHVGSYLITLQSAVRFSKHFGGCNIFFTNVTFSHFS